jgi:hypothetical protein
MKLRLQALRALRWNYKWSGVWVWLKGRGLTTCELCEGAGHVCKNFGLLSPGRPEIIDCPKCIDGKQRGPRGCQRILSEPQRVVDEQTALAEGVMG